MHLSRWMMRICSLLPVRARRAPFFVEEQLLCCKRECFDAKVGQQLARKLALGVVPITTEYQVKDVPAGILLQSEFVELREAEEVDEDEYVDEDDEDGNPVEPPDPEPAEADCGYSEEAIIAHGGDKGKTMRICRNPGCPVHGPRLKDSLTYSPKREAAKDIWKERAAALPRKIDFLSRLATLRHVLAAQRKTESLSHELLQVIAEAMLPFSLPFDFIESCQFPWTKGADKGKNGALLVKELKNTIGAPALAPAGAHLEQIILGLALYECAKDYCGPKTEKRLAKAAELLGVDAKKIAADVSKFQTEDFRRRRDAAKAKQKPAPKAKSTPKAKEKKKAIDTGTEDDQIPGAVVDAMRDKLARSYPQPDASGAYLEKDCTALVCPVPGLAAELLTIECEDGFRYALTASLTGRQGRRDAARERQTARE